MTPILENNLKAFVDPLLGQPVLCPHVASIGTGTHFTAHLVNGELAALWSTRMTAGGDSGRRIGTGCNRPTVTFANSAPPHPVSVLHGTDEPELFSNTVRDFSHGCIRVQKPADLAAWALRNNPGWDLERVKATMNGTEENVQVNLVTTIPVLIVYGTAAVNEAGEVFFFDDIYGYDTDLEKALAKGYPYPW
jgi:hypothetical protein